MKLTGKALSTAVLAALMGAAMAGTALATPTDQEMNEVRQAVNTNTNNISDLSSRVETLENQGSTDYSADIAANKAATGTNASAIATETSNREAGDTALDTRITNVKKYLENEMGTNYVSKEGYKNDTTAADAGVVKESQTVGENLTAVGKGLSDETAARIGADQSLSDRINANYNNLEQFKTDVSSVVAQTASYLNGEIGKTNTALANETAAREAGDSTNAANIATNTQSIANNTTAINNNSSRINQEINDRTASDQYLQNQINNNNTSINDLYGRYSSLKTDINKVGARSAALAGLHPLDFDPDNKFNFAVSSGPSAVKTA